MPPASDAGAGTPARPPQHLSELVSGDGRPQLDALTIQPSDTWRLDENLGMRPNVAKSGGDIVISGVPHG